MLLYKSHGCIAFVIKKKRILKLSRNWENDLLLMKSSVISLPIRDPVTFENYKFRSNYFFFFLVAVVYSGIFYMHWNSQILTVKLDDFRYTYSHMNIIIVLLLLLSLTFMSDSGWCFLKNSFIEAWLTYNQLHIFKVYNLISFNMERRVSYLWVSILDMDLSWP